jgi:hypothetical protein
MLRLFVLMCGFASLGAEVKIMKSSIRTFALRFAATVALFAPAAAAQAQGVGHSVCKNVWDWGSAKYVQVCNSVYYPPPPSAPPPAPEPPVRAHTTGSESTVGYDPAAEARKSQLRATEHQDPARSLCPPPYRMTASDGCQR